MKTPNPPKPTMSELEDKFGAILDGYAGLKVWGRDPYNRTKFVPTDKNYMIRSVAIEELETLFQAYTDRAVKEKLQLVYDYPKGRYSTDVYDMQNFVHELMDALTISVRDGGKDA